MDKLTRQQVVHDLAIAYVTSHANSLASAKTTLAFYRKALEDYSIADKEIDEIMRLHEINALKSK